MHRTVHANSTAHSIFTVIGLFQTFSWNRKVDFWISSIFRFLLQLCSSGGSWPSYRILTPHGFWPLDWWEWDRLSSVWRRTWLASTSSEPANICERDPVNMACLLLASDTGRAVWLWVSFKTSVLFLYISFSLFLIFFWKKVVFSLKWIGSFWPEKRAFKKYIHS